MEDGTASSDLRRRAWGSKRSYSRLSLARQSIQAGDLSEVVVDRLIAVMDYSIEEYRNAGTVKKKKAEINLTQAFQSMDDFCSALLKSKNRDALRSLFGGDCLRIARLTYLTAEGALTEGVENARVACAKQVVSVEDILSDMGLASALAAAKEVAKHEHEISKAVEADANDQVLVALRASQEAAQLEKDGDIAEAREKYDSSKRMLDHTLLVLAAVARFKRRRALGESRTMQDMLREKGEEASPAAPSRPSRSSRKSQKDLRVSLGKGMEIEVTPPKRRPSLVEAVSAVRSLTNEVPALQAIEEEREATIADEDREKLEEFSKKLEDKADDLEKTLAEREDGAPAQPAEPPVKLPRLASIQELEAQADARNQPQDPDGFLSFSAKVVLWCASFDAVTRGTRFTGTGGVLLQRTVKWIAHQGADTFKEIPGDRS